MNNKPEIREPESDGIVLNACLDMPDGLRHRHAQSVLKKYSQPDELAISILRVVRGVVSDTIRLSIIHKILSSDVYLYGSEVEKLVLSVKLFDEDKPNSSDN